MLYDISSKESAFDFLQSFLDITKSDLDRFISSNTIQTKAYTDTTKIHAQSLFATLSIESKNLETGNIEVLGIHYTSNDDNNESILSEGMGDLQYALSHDTPLFRFLKSKGILFNIEERRMLVDETSYDIRYTQYDYEKPLTGIARKVYYDNQLSCFLNLKDITNYAGKVHIRPEFLFNIDRMFPKKELSRAWANRCNRYCVKFKAAVSKFTAYTFYDKSDYTDMSDERLKLIYSLVDKALLVASDNGSGEIFAYMKPDTIIPPDCIVSITELS